MCVSKAKTVGGGREGERVSAIPCSGRCYYRRAGYKVQLWINAVRYCCC